MQEGRCRAGAAPCAGCLALHGYRVQLAFRPGLCLPPTWQGRPSKARALLVSSTDLQAATAIKTGVG